MTVYPYLIVGGGMSAHAAVEGIRSIDPDQPIALIGADTHPPYARPPLSKALWMDASKRIGDTDLGTERHGVQLFLGRRATALDPLERTVEDDDGERFGYERLLLATGSRPRTLPDLPAGGPVLAYRTRDDFEEARRRARPGHRAVVIGGGFIGCEMAASLRTAGMEVTLVYPDPVLGGGRFPEGLARALEDDYRSRGVRLHPGRRVSAAQRRENDATVALDDGTALRGDLVVIGIGTIPNGELARELGTTDDGGIVVDEHLRTRDPRIFAAGDVAAFPHPTLGRRTRIEHEDAALSTGRHAGRAMAGEVTAFEHTPMFYSDLFDNGYEAVGELDAGLHTLEAWTEPLRAGTVYYHDGARLRGVLLFNTFGKVERATELLARGSQVDLGALGPL